MDPGDTRHRGFSLRPHLHPDLRRDLSLPRERPNFDRWVALMSVERNGEADGLHEHREAVLSEQAEMTTEVGIRSTPLEDLYVILADVEDIEGIVANDPGAQQIVAEVQVNPLVGWIWYGGGDPDHRLPHRPVAGGGGSEAGHRR